MRRPATEQLLLLAAYTYELVARERMQSSPGSIDFYLSSSLRRLTLSTLLDLATYIYDLGSRATRASLQSLALMIFIKF